MRKLLRRVTPELKVPKASSWSRTHEFLPMLFPLFLTKYNCRYIASPIFWNMNPSCIHKWKYTNKNTQYKQNWSIFFIRKKTFWTDINSRTFFHAWKNYLRVLLHMFNVCWNQIHFKLQFDLCGPFPLLLCTKSNTSNLRWK